jgi:ornithine carbamoyltransferase
MVDLVMIRTFEQTKIERFATYSRVPVINGLTNEFHPCQILADIFTFIEHRGPIQGKTVAWVGDGNNMANTWLQAAELLDFKVNVSTPGGYEVDEKITRPSRIQWMPAGAPTWSPRTSGQAWATKQKTRFARRRLLPGGSVPT